MADMLPAINIVQLTNSAMNAFTGNIHPESDVEITTPSSKPAQHTTSVSSCATTNSGILPPISPLIKKSWIKSRFQPIAPKTSNHLGILGQSSGVITPGFYGTRSHQTSRSLETQQQATSNQNIEILKLSQQIMPSNNSDILSAGQHMQASEQNLEIPGNSNQNLSSETSSEMLDTCQQLSVESQEILNVGQDISSSRTSGILTVGQGQDITTDLRQDISSQALAIFNSNQIGSSGQQVSPTLMNSGYDSHISQNQLDGVKGQGHRQTEKDQIIASVAGYLLANNLTIANVAQLGGQLTNNSNISTIQQMLDSRMVTSITQQISNMNQVPENTTAVENTHVIASNHASQIPVNNDHNISHSHIASCHTASTNSFDNAESHILSHFNGMPSQDSYTRATLSNTNSMTQSTSETMHMGSLRSSKEHQPSNEETINLSMNEAISNSQPIDLSHFNVHDAVTIHLSNPEINPVDSLTDSTCASQAIVQDLYLTRHQPDVVGVQLDQPNTEQNDSQLHDDTIQNDERAISCNIQEYLTIQNIAACMAESDESINQSIPGIEEILASGITSLKDLQNLQDKHHPSTGKVIETVLRMVGKQNQMTSSATTNQSVTLVDNASALPLHQSMTGTEGSLAVSHQTVGNTNRMASKPEMKTSNACSLFTHYCIECRMSLIEPCQYHDSQNHQHVVDSPIPPYSQLSLPCIFYLRQSSTSTLEQTFGVFSKVKILSNTKFGPLIGKLTSENELKENRGHFPIWKIFQENKSDEILMDDGTTCNWLMYLRAARSDETQNILAHQIGTYLCFFAIKDILPDEELLFWYSKEYAKVIGVPICPSHMKIAECLICGNIYKSRKFLTLHERKVHPNENPKRFKCNMCSHRFPSASKLNIHTLSHIGVKPHSCGICGKRFNDPSNLRAHTAIHTGVKSFTCSVCNKGFRQKAHLQAHMLTHTGTKSFPCEYCGKTFARQGDLKTHVYTHTEEKTYPCMYCGKKFYKLQNFKRHILIHSGEKNFICNLCNKTFYTKYHLERHCKTCKGLKNRFLGSNQSKNTTLPDTTDWDSSSITVKEIHHVRKTDPKKVVNEDHLVDPSEENMSLCL